MAIVGQNLSVERLGRPVLRGVPFRIDAGECVSIIGPNGAGKSTLMAALLGMLPLSSGRVEIDGRSVETLSRRDIARRIAFVPQLQEGYLGFRVQDVLESARYAHVSPLDPLGDADLAAIETAAKATRIETLLPRTIDTLSGGERQKVWIAAALAQSSPALFLDEPTNALDPAHQADLIEIMRGVLRAGRTLLVICHDLNLPLALGGRVVALQAGSLIFDEKVSVLREIERIDALFGTHFEMHHGPGEDRFSIQLRQDA